MGVLRRVLTIAVADVAFMTAGAEASVFAAGHYYTPIHGGWVVEWNGSLQEVRRFRVQGGLDYVTGSAFGDGNNLVLMGYRAGAARLLQIDADGAVLNEYNTGNGSLLGGSYIDYDHTSKRYVFADDHRITVLNSALQLVGSSGPDFQRASGVAFDRTGQFMYATDQVVDGVKVYTGSTPTLVETLYYHASTATGMDVDSDGTLLLTQFVNGRVDRLNPITGAITPIVTGLGYGGATDVKALPNGNILVVNFPTRLQIYSPSGQLLAQSVNAGNFGDSVAFFVPAPATTAIMAMAALAYRRRRLDSSY